MNTELSGGTSDMQVLKSREIVEHLIQCFECAIEFQGVDGGGKTLDL